MTLSDSQFYDLLRILLKDPLKEHILLLANIYQSDMKHYDSRIPLSKAFIDYKKAKKNVDPTIIQQLTEKLTNYNYSKYNYYYTKELLDYLLKEAKHKRRLGAKDF